MEHGALVTTVMAVLVVLFVAAVSAVITKRIRSPHTVGLVLIGVAVAFIADDCPELSHALGTLKLEELMIRFLSVPILIFESALHMDVPVLMHNLVLSLVPAGPDLQLSIGLIDGLICQSILAVTATGVVDVEAITGGVIDLYVAFFGRLLVGLGFCFAWLVMLTIPLIGNQPLVHITFTLEDPHVGHVPSLDSDHGTSGGRGFALQAACLSRCADWCGETSPESACNPCQQGSRRERGHPRTSDHAHMIATG